MVRYLLLTHCIGLLVIVAGIAVPSPVYILAGLGIVFISDGLLIAVDYHEHRITESPD
jgi:hypothetical protein